jgi:hypothetical protein
MRKREAKVSGLLISGACLHHSDERSERLLGGPVETAAVLESNRPVVINAAGKTKRADRPEPGSRKRLKRLDCPRDSDRDMLIQSPNKPSKDQLVRELHSANSGKVLQNPQAPRKQPPGRDPQRRRPSAGKL